MASTSELGIGGTGPTSRRMVLGTQLRRLREREGITRGEAGYQIRCSESKISRMELGRVGFKERDVDDLLTLYGVHDPAERAVFTELVKESNRTAWWNPYSDLLHPNFQALVGLEEAASRIQTFEMQFVPGLMQTREYAEAIVRGGVPTPSEDQVERLLAVRMRRQRLLHRPGAPRLWAVIDESVLHRPLVREDRGVLRRQIDHLLELTTLPHITLQVLTFEAPGFAAEGSFSMLRFEEPDLPDQVYLESLVAASYLEKPHEVERYGRALDRLAVDAETPASSRQLLSKRRSEI
jgi:transcriptional regulator with XRE-family HTH domain